MFSIVQSCATIATSSCWIAGMTLLLTSSCFSAPAKITPPDEDVPIAVLVMPMALARAPNNSARPKQVELDRPGTAEANLVAPVRQMAPPVGQPRHRSRPSPDGYTLRLANGANAISATLYEKLSFDFIRDIAPVASIGDAPIVMVTNLSFPAKTVSEGVIRAANIKRE
jgi:hypothetical protein